MNNYYKYYFALNVSIQMKTISSLGTKISHDCLPYYQTFCVVSLVKVKVKCTAVQALRLCTDRTAYRGSRGIGKGKVHPCTGTEALYRPYGL